MSLVGNRFTGNKVERSSSEWRFRDAGAIYFKCYPDEVGEEGDYPCETILDSNIFEKNSAVNMGGALRYVNTNFTTVFSEPESELRRLSKRGLQPEQLGADTNIYR